MLNRFILILSTLTLLSTSCKDDSTKSLSKSVGKYGELLVVVDTLYERSGTAEILSDIFQEEVVALPQIEPMFRMNTVSHKGFGSILKSARNLLILRVSPSFQPRILVKENVWAKDQLLIEIKAASQSQLHNILLKNKTALQAYFNDKELQRLQNQFTHSVEKDLVSTLEDSFKITLSIPPAFFPILMDSNSFWLQKEKSLGQHQVIQALFYYEYPYTSDSSFALSEMISNRNTYGKNYLKGAVKGSYMLVYDKYKPQMDTLLINNMYAVEYRGLWNMHNDFMGGPFLHYTILDEENNRILNLDAFVYAPKFSKREYLRELEAIAKSVETL